LNADDRLRRGATRLAARPRTPAGFTLVEALIALLLMALVLPVAMHAVARCMQLGVDTDRRAEAAALAHDRLAEAVMRREWETGSASGVFTDGQADDPDRYRWEMRVDDWEGTLLFKRVTLTVRWEARGTEKAFALTTLVNAEEGDPSADSEDEDADAELAS